MLSLYLLGGIDLHFFTQHRQSYLQLWNGRSYRPVEAVLLVTAALPYLLCGMSSVGTSAQVFPTPNSQNLAKGRGGWEDRRKRKRISCKVDMTGARKAAIRQWDCTVPLKRVPCSPQGTASHPCCSTQIQRSQPPVWKHKLMGVTVYRLQKGILLLTDCTKLRFKRGRDNM